MRIIVFFSMLYMCAFSIQGQEIHGRVTDRQGEALEAVIMVPKKHLSELTDAQGRFHLHGLTAGFHELEVRSLGYRSKRQTIELGSDQNLQIIVQLEEDPLELEAAVVTGTRSPLPVYASPVMVQRIAARTFELTQSISLSEGLNFTPGLRLENNCQNCGFTQVRMNGLEGAYTQVLINSRPVYSALASVYGLELLPAGMIDRIEVVRGGGSVLYGGNAIGGTLNIITKDPTSNEMDLQIQQSLVNGEASDRSFSFSGSRISENGKRGLRFFSFQREREAWDANGDGFSELTSIENVTLGLDGFQQFSPRTRLSAKYLVLHEDRRGGSDFDLQPHQARLAEALDHRLHSANLSLEHHSANYRHRFAVYGAGQWIERGSYYGQGGRVLAAGDSLSATDFGALNAYGEANDLSLSVGWQYAFDLSESLQFTAGMEGQSQDVSDRMPGYRRSIEQSVFTLGHYLQAQLKPTEQLTLLAGGRFDVLHIDGSSQLGHFTGETQARLKVFVPRLTALYELRPNIRLRAAYAEGYRGPQAFDEDLHIDLVGGLARFVRLDDQLLSERSRSLHGSLTADKQWGNTQAQVVAEYFHTRLENAFILANPIVTSDGTMLITKQNGSGARVEGVNLLAQIAFASRWQAESSFTFQQANYEEDEVIWSDEEGGQGETVSTDALLRTPNLYGYLTMSYEVTSEWSAAVSGVFTGSMLVPHVIDDETAFTVLRESPSFFELNLRFQWKPMKGRFEGLSVSTGVHNLLQSYQDDFDRGPLRDAGYVYGPMRPRTPFLALGYRF